MHKILTIGYYGNGKSTNRYHIPFLMRRKDRIRVKTIYARHLRDDWARWEGVYYTDKAEELLQDPEIDVIVVTTPPQAHAIAARQIIEAGKNVVVEKPFTHSAEEAQALFDLAREKGVKIQCYQNRRFDSDFLTVQKVIESGKLGEITEVEMSFDYYRPEVPGKAAEYVRADSFVYSHACHTVDQVLSYFGIPDRHHYDVRQMLGQGRMNDYFDLDLYYEKGTDKFDVMPGGLKVSVKSSYFRAKERPSFVVYGRRGTFVKAQKDRQEADLKKFYLPDHSDFGLDTPDDYGTLSWYDEKGRFQECKVESVPGDYGIYYDHLYETILNDAAPLVSEEQTMTQMRILEEATAELY